MTDSVGSAPARSRSDNTPRTRAALAGAAAVGPYFVVDVDPPVGPDWRPFTSLTEHATLRERVEAVGSTLAARTGGQVDTRACASLDFLALASRLSAPMLAVAAFEGLVPAVGPHQVFWRAVDAGPIPIGVVAATGEPAGDVVTSADALHRHVIDGLITPLVEAYAVTFRLSTKVLWGNASSALAGAALMIDRSGLPVRHPPGDIVRELLDTPRLRGTGRYREGGAGTFVRHNCCLFYRVPGAETCADCVLTAS